MTVVVRSPGRLVRVLTIGAATVMFAACTSSPNEPAGDSEGAESESLEDQPAKDAGARSLEDQLAEDAVGYREDVAVTATMTATEPKSEQWLLDATVTRELHQFQIAGLKISWDLPGDAQVTGFEGECTTVSDRQTCLTASNLFARTAEQIKFELLVDLPTASIDRTVVVSVTYQSDRYDYNTANNTTTLELE